VSIDLLYPNRIVIVIHRTADCQSYHFVWGLGKVGEAADDKNVKAAY